MKFFIHAMFLILFSFSGMISESASDMIPDSSSVCSLVNCGQGTCKPSPNLLGFECECFPGWNKLPLLPPCIIPNCTASSGCGKSPPSLVPPPVASPNLNLSDPCSINLCGDGECVADGLFPKCNCNAGSDNLLNLTVLPCFRKCSSEGDCNSILMVPPSPAASDAAQLSRTGISIVGIVLMAALLHSCFLSL